MTPGPRCRRDAQTHMRRRVRPSARSPLCSLTFFVSLRLAARRVPASAAERPHEPFSFSCARAPLPKASSKGRRGHARSPRDFAPKKSQRKLFRGCRLSSVTILEYDRAAALELRAAGPVGPVYGELLCSRTNIHWPAGGWGTIPPPRVCTKYPRSVAAYFERPRVRYYAVTPTAGTEWRRPRRNYTSTTSSRMCRPAPPSR